MNFTVVVNLFAYLRKSVSGRLGSLKTILPTDLSYAATLNFIICKKNVLY